MFMNEYIDSTVGRIPVCLLCSLLVTIRGLVGPFKSVGNSTFVLSVENDNDFRSRFE
jgi:hypothetical protein